MVERMNEREGSKIPEKGGRVDERASYIADFRNIGYSGVCYLLLIY